MAIKYVTSYAMRYQIPSLQEQIEVATIVAAGIVINEDPAIPDHENRIAWAAWANKNSSVAWIAFAWAVSMDEMIQASVAIDPTGQSIPDADVQSVVNNNLNKVIADFTASNIAAAAAGITVIR